LVRLVTLGASRAKTEFNLDKIWRYDAVGYDENRVFLTGKQAYLDHLTNRYHGSGNGSHVSPWRMYCSSGGSASMKKWRTYAPVSRV
jgi:hypothetical protein